MIQEFAASDDLRISQVEVISKCEGLSNLSVRMRLIMLHSWDSHCNKVVENLF